MKRLLYALVVIGLAILCCPWQSFAQGDTVTVTPGTFMAAINADTLAGGVRAHPDRVYKFQRGKIYQVTEPLKINGNFYAVANDSPGIRPPVLAPAILLDNSSVDHFFDLIGKQGKIYVSNLYFLSQRSDNNWLGWSDCFRVNADSVSLTMRGVIGEGFSNCFVVPNFWMKTNWQDCVFRNGQHASSYFGGQIFRGPGNMCLDTTIMVNNTFFSNNSYLIDIRGYTPLAVFEHNTCVYGIVNPLLCRQASNFHVKNNIWYAMHSYGGVPVELIEGWFLNYPDTATSPIIQFRGNDSTSYWANLWWNATDNKPGVITGPEVYVDATHGITAAMLDPTKRIFDVRGNDFFLPTKLQDFVKAYSDTVTALNDTVTDAPNYHAAPGTHVYRRTLQLPTWLSKYALWSIDSGAGKLSQGIQIEKTPYNLDPGFPADVNGQVDPMIGFIYRIATKTLSSQRWTFPDTALYPPRWPLPENLAYTNTTLMNGATDGFAVGDLNWFPSQKASWVTTGVEKVNSAVPVEFTLSQNYPNPFNPSTTIDYEVPSHGLVSLTIFNLLGQRVADLVHGEQTPGRHTIRWNASNLASGVYFYRLTQGQNVMTKKLMLLK